MPNDFGRKGHAMRIRCPHCEKYCEQKVVKTAPEHFRHSESATSVLTSLVGKDVHFRERTRQCKNCGHGFNTAELDEQYLLSLIDSLCRVHHQALEVQAQKAALESEIADLKEKQDDVSARAMNTLAELRDPTISRRAIGLVPITAAREHSAGPSSGPVQ